MEQRPNAFWLTLGSMLILLGSLVGCGNLEPPVPPPEIRVERVPSENSFRVTWILQEPVRALAFRRAPGLRQNRWRPLGKGFRFESRHGTELLVSASETKRFQVIIPESAASFQADYPFLSFFSDGGVVLYTGHLQASPLRCEGGGRRVDCSLREMEKSRGTRRLAHLEALSSSGEILVSGSQAKTRSLRLVLPQEGSFVYFGRRPVYRFDQFQMISDPSLPAWVVEEAQSLLPAILELNANRLGRKLSTVPVVYLTYSKNASSVNLSHSGAVAGHQITLSLYGPRWLQRNAASVEEFQRLLAHEAFHLWNASLFHSVGRPGSRWLHEGSAEFFAFISLFELGKISHGRYKELLTESLNKCLLGLNGKTLPESDFGQSVRNHYNCGAIVKSAMHHETQHYGWNLWRVWRGIFDRASVKGGFYDQEDFFGVIADAAGTSELAPMIRSFVKGNVGSDSSELEAYFFRLFAAIGIPLVASEIQWPEWYARSAGERALSEALSADCRGEGFILTTHSGVRLAGGPRCRHFKLDHEIRRVANYRVWRDGVQIYDLIKRSCASSEMFQLGSNSDGEAMWITCPSLPARPRFMRFDSVPIP
jgi:hypothetical protein